MPRAKFWTNPYVIGGVLTIFLGAFVLFESSDYARGSLLRMGPGYFPAILGTVLLVLGALMLASSGRGAIEEMDSPEIRAPICIGLAITLFALTLPRFGLAPAIGLLIPVAACASPSTRLGPTIVLTVLLIGFAWLVFVQLLSLPLVLLTW